MLWLFAGLLACTGAVDGGGLGGGPGVPGGSGGPLGGLGETNNAVEGTLSSQSGYQEMEGGCGNDNSLRFAGEGKAEPWLLRTSDPSYFPKATVGTVDETGDSFTPCSDCQGRVLRVIDLGKAPGDPSNHLPKYKMQFIGWAFALGRDNWDPALLPLARYQDYPLSNSGEVDLSGREMLLDHLYYFLVSKQPMAPVTSPTAFASIEEFNAMATCSKSKSSQNTSPFLTLRLAHILDKKPVELDMGSGPVQLPEDSEDSDEPGRSLIKAVPSDATNALPLK